jgi:hypothetical protein
MFSKTLFDELVVIENDAAEGGKVNGKNPSVRLTHLHKGFVGLGSELVKVPDEREGHGTYIRVIIYCISIKSCPFDIA